MIASHPQTGEAGLQRTLMDGFDAAFQRDACRRQLSPRAAISISCSLVAALDKRNCGAGVTHAVGQFTQGGGIVTR